LNAELETFRVRKHNTFFERDESYIDQRAWLTSRGALTKDGAVVIGNYRPARYTSDGKVSEPLDCDPIHFEELTDQWEQWIAWKARKEFAKRKAEEQYETLAAMEDLGRKIKTF